MCVAYIEDCGYGAQSRENLIALVFFVKQELEWYKECHKIGLQLLSKGAERSSVANATVN